MAIEWTTDVDSASWWPTALHPFGQDVGSILPDHYDAYARIFHPLEAATDARRRTWAEIAAANGRIAHADMQLHDIMRPRSVPPQRGGLPPPIDSVAEGSLPRDLIAATADVIGRTTATLDRIWCAVWDGFGHLHGGASNVVTFGSHRGPSTVDRRPPLVPQHVLDGPRLTAPGRTYVVARCGIADVVDLHDALDGQSPNAWWPDDRAWFVATEIDFTWSYVGADRQTIDRVLSSPALEAAETAPDRVHTFDGDHLNR